MTRSASTASQTEWRAKMPRIHAASSAVVCGTRRPGSVARIAARCTAIAASASAPNRAGSGRRMRIAVTACGQPRRSPDALRPRGADARGGAWRIAPAPRRMRIEHRAEVVTGVTRRDLDDFFRRSFGDDAPASAAAFGSEVDDPVGGLDDVEIVLDHDHRIAVVAQPVQHREQHLDVVEMKAGRRLVEDVERAAGVALGQLERQLHALRLAARQGRRRLARA